MGSYFLSRTENAVDTAVWDVDGTLARFSLLIWLHAVNDVSHEYNVHIPGKDMASHLAHDPYAAPNYGLPHDLAVQFGDRVRARTLEILCDWPMQSPNKVQKMLLGLKESGMVHGVASSANSPWAHALLEKMGISDLFEIIMTRDDVPMGETKPRPTQINRVIEHVGADPKRTAMIGDSKSDLLAGAAAKVGMVVHYSPLSHWPYHTKSEEMDEISRMYATHRAQTFAQVERILRHGSLR